MTAIDLDGTVRPTGGPNWREYGPVELDPVLTAALAAVLETGYYGCSMRDIAARCGLSAPGIYHHYPSKQSMLVALLDIVMEDLAHRSQAALADGDDHPAQRFARLIENLALFHTHRQQLAFVGASEMRSMEPASRRRIGTLRKAQQYLVDEQVLAAVSCGTFTTPQPRLAARAVVTMCAALAQWFQPGGPITPEEVAEQYVGFALDVMTAR